MKLLFAILFVFSQFAYAKEIITTPEQTAVLLEAFTHSDESIPEVDGAKTVYTTYCNQMMESNCVMQLDPTAPFGNPGVSARIFDDPADRVIKVLGQISRADFDGVALVELTFSKIACTPQQCTLEVGFSGGALN